MIGCLVAAACLDACWLGELSEHPMWPHSAQRRRGTQQPFGVARHSTHTVPLGFEAVLIPRRSCFISDFPFVPSVRKKISSHQQNLHHTTLLRCSLSVGCLAEWQFAADRDHQFAIANGFSHELKSFRIRCRVHRYHLYGWVLLGIPCAPRTDANTPLGLTLAISVSAVLPLTVSATTSSIGRFAIALSSSVATN